MVQQFITWVSSHYVAVAGAIVGVYEFLAYTVPSVKDWTLGGRIFGWLKEFYDKQPKKK